MQLITSHHILVVADNLLKDQKIQAIKELRSATNLGLKESKDIVDRACGGSGQYPNPPKIQDYDTLVERLKAEVEDAMPPGSVGWDRNELIIDQGSVEALISINKAVLSELKEMNELLKDVMEAME